MGKINKSIIINAILAVSILIGLVVSNVSVFFRYVKNVWNIPRVFNGFALSIRSGQFWLANLVARHPIVLFLVVGVMLLFFMAMVQYFVMRKRGYMND